MEAVETIELDEGIVINVYPEEYVEDPRKEWDHVATMFCGHSRYNLGDEQLSGDTDLVVSVIQHFGLDMKCSVCGGDMEESYGELVHYDEDSECEGKSLDVENLPLVMMPLYLFDHSGLSISTSKAMFQMADSAGWDWGLLGVIAMTHDQFKKAWETEDFDEEKAKACMESEVEEYDQYLTGDVYWFSVEDVEGDALESCGGFYGIKSCLEEARSVAEHCVAEAVKERKNIEERLEAIRRMGE